MDAFTNSTTQATLANLMDQLKLLTNQLYNFEFEANDVQVYPTLCKYCDEPHMSINCQMEDPFAQVQSPHLPLLSLFYSYNNKIIILIIFL